jgi:hypothetical protein
MTIRLFDLFSDTRNAKIDHYLQQTGIELTTFVRNDVPVRKINQLGHKLIVHVLLAAYIKRCLHVGEKYQTKAEQSTHGMQPEHGIPDFISFMRARNPVFGPK